MRHLLNWALSALAVWIVARLVPGFHVSGPLAALIAALVIGFVNATLGVFLKIVTFPLVLLTLGLFWLVINAAMIELASAVVPGFHVDTFGAAFVGAIVLALVNMFFRWLAGREAGAEVRSRFTDHLEVAGTAGPSDSARLRVGDDKLHRTHFTRGPPNAAATWSATDSHATRNP